VVADLNSISGKMVQLDGNIALTIGIPSKKFGSSLYVNGWALGGGEAIFTQADETAITDALTVATTLDPNNPLLTDTTVLTTTDTLTSSVHTLFVLFAEVGISFAREIQLGGQSIAVGITPKFVKVKTYDFIFSGSTLDTAEVTLDSGETSESNFNLDIGFSEDLNNGWKTGLTVKNLIAQEYNTVENNVITVEPMARIGVSHQTDWTLVAVDVDLTENDPVAFEAKTQYVSFGAELDVFDSAQLRVGYRTNLSDTGTAASDFVSAGIGLSPFGIHLDLAVAGDTDGTEVGIALQTGFRF